MAPIAWNSVQAIRAIHCFHMIARKFYSIVPIARIEQSSIWAITIVRPGRPDRPSTFRHCFHIIAWIVCTLFRAIGATRAIGAIIWKPGFNRELKQPRRRRQQKPHKFAYLTVKNYFCTLCTCIFHLLTFWRRSRSFYDVKWPVLQWRREHMMTNVQFVSLCPKRWFQINSRTVRRHYSSIPDFE